MYQRILHIGETIISEGKILGQELIKEDDGLFEGVAQRESGEIEEHGSLRDGEGGKAHKGGSNAETD